MRHGWGVCKYADGPKFRGEWKEDAWVQSLADPGRCRAKGPGLSRAVSGKEAAFLISVRALYYMLHSLSAPQFVSLLMVRGEGWSSQ